MKILANNVASLKNWDSRKFAQVGKCFRFGMQLICHRTTLFQLFFFYFCFAFLYYEHCLFASSTFFFWKTCVLELQNEMPDELFQSQFQLQTFWGACPINRSRLVFDTMQQKSEASPLVVAPQDTHSIIARFYSWCHLLNIYHFIFWRQKHARIVEKKDKRWNSWRRINSGRTTIITVVGHSNKKYKKTKK